ncbi:hypothetical protein BDV25DRAFT_135603 [Aspergillus avenaceus]|uniref:Uncharacterized protein n=1 Tax=Aspergillus avenaceus TaxID=36643 RepID=A0A5N6U7V3_ASPAV|nr:hypothetical protein BDV25DRAFT_135603 [Aspergillus avenaceus]
MQSSSEKPPSPDKPTQYDIIVRINDPTVQKPGPEGSLPVTQIKLACDVFMEIAQKTLPADDTPDEDADILRKYFLSLAHSDTIPDFSIYGEELARLLSESDAIIALTVSILDWRVLHKSGKNSIAENAVLTIYDRLVDTITNYVSRLLAAEHELSADHRHSTEFGPLVYTFIKRFLDFRAKVDSELLVEISEDIIESLELAAELLIFKSEIESFPKWLCLRSVQPLTLMCYFALDSQDSSEGGIPDGLVSTVAGDLVGGVEEVA